MKGKTWFTQDEWNQIKSLIKQKLVTSSDEQKIIRNKIRALGFYFSDFSDKKGYTLQDVEELVSNERITILNEYWASQAEAYKKYPLIIDLHIQMDQPNDILPLYAGVFKLKRQYHEIEVDGNLFFQWLPSPSCRFKGIATNINKSTFELLPDLLEDWELIVDGLEFSYCCVTGSDLDGSKTVEGRCSGITIKGDRSIPVTKVYFAIPNFKELFGLTVREEKADRLSLHNNRWVLTSDKYKISFDHLPEYKERQEQLKSIGGYQLLYACRLDVLKGSFTFADQKKIVFLLNTFLSFINGRKTSALLIKGMHQEEVIYEDFTNYIVDTYKHVETWAPSG